MRITRRSIVLSAGGLCAIGAVAFLLLRHEGSCRFTAFDVGQGDSLFFETPSGRQMLIDGGPSDAVLAKLGRVMPFFDRSLDVVVLTHPDADHVTGLVEVARRFRIGIFIMTGVIQSTPAYVVLQQELAERDVPIHYARSGERLKLDADATFSILLPTQDWRGKKPKDTNNTSVVGKFVCRTLSVLATDDMEEPSERELLRTVPDISADILKVGHHGSKTSSSEAFLDRVQPKAAVISVGKDNTFGHPNDIVLDRLIQRSIPIYRTDQLADVVVQSDGHGFHITRGLGFRLW